MQIAHFDEVLTMGYGLGYSASPLSVPYTLHPTLYTISASAPASNLSPYRLIYLPFGSVLTQMPQADARAIRSSAGQNPHSRPKGDKCGEWFEEHSRSFEEHWNLFGATLRRRMREREMDKKEPPNHIWAAMFWTFIWRCLNVVWHQHQIYPWIDNNWR